MTNEKIEYNPETEKEWYVVKVPCTDGKDRVGIDMSDWGNRTLLRDLTYDEALRMCPKMGKEHNIPMFNGENSPGYDVDWKQIEYK
jgi:hypothetical protein